MNQILNNDVIPMTYDTNIIISNVMNNTVIGNNETEYVKKKYKGRKVKTDKDIKSSKDAIVIPSFSSHSTFLIKTFTIPQLKDICRFYKLKVTGNKQVLTNKVYHYLYFSSLN